ncbi:unnamed protein product, partial [Amoebophrya sp. A120]|eukprot:GSA120T00025523001.1
MLSDRNVLGRLIALSEQENPTWTVLVSFVKLIAYLDELLHFALDEKITLWTLMEQNEGLQGSNHSTMAHSFKHFAMERARLAAIDFATPSREIVETFEGTGAASSGVPAASRNRRGWEERAHPYLIPTRNQVLKHFGFHFRDGRIVIAKNKPLRGQPQEWEEEKLKGKHGSIDPGVLRWINEQYSRLNSNPDSGSTRTQAPDASDQMKKWCKDNAQLLLDNFSALFAQLNIQDVRPATEFLLRWKTNPAELTSDQQAVATALGADIERAVSNGTMTPDPSQTDFDIKPGAPGTFLGPHIDNASRDQLLEHLRD